MSKHIFRPKLWSPKGVTYELNYLFLRVLEKLNIGNFLYAKKDQAKQEIPIDLIETMEYNYHEFVEDFEGSSYQEVGLGNWAYDNSKWSVAHFLYSLCDRLQCKAFLEIGTYIGTSSMAILNLMHRRNIKDFIIVTIDIENFFERSKFSQNTLKLLQTYKNNVNFIIGDSSNPQTVSIVKEILRASVHNFFDLVFIDGLHIPFQIVADFHNYKDIIKPGGVALFDDLDQYFGYECFWAPAWPVPPLMQGTGRQLLLAWTTDHTPAPHLIGAIQKLS